MAVPRTRFELRVETVLSPAALATFCVPVKPTDVPRNTVYRFRIPGDRDPYEVLHRLTEHDVLVLELRRCHEPSRRQPVASRPPEGRQEDSGGVAPADPGVVIPFPTRSGYRAWGSGPAPDTSA